ncbi:MAG: hypothetical protein N2109_06855 [Fimbriimonadales bacterium]|nr:hypothetical protein [Fimbriimonadales bacterium]
MPARRAAPRDLEEWADLYGGAGEHAAWQAVEEAFRKDDLEAAYALALRLGAGGAGAWLGLYRSIEAEALTRRRAARKPLAPGLELEYVDDEVGGLAPSIGRWTLEAADQAARRLGFDRLPPLLATVLTDEADAPWVPMRHGYCEPKERFFKICLPAYLADDPEDFRSAVRHEVAHALCLDAAGGRMAHWLEEAVAMVIGDECDPAALRKFGSGRWPWLDPRRLEDAFGEDRETPEGRDLVHRAYEQAGVLGSVLAERCGEAALGEVARRIGRTGFLRELAARLAGLGPEDPALRSVAGWGVRRLFREGWRRCLR